MIMLCHYILHCMARKAMVINKVRDGPEAKIRNFEWNLIVITLRNYNRIFYTLLIVKCIEHCIIVMYLNVYKNK